MVNLSARLMAATSQFKVFINISENVYSYLTPKIKKYLRLIDKVTVKGSSIPMKIYCFDLNVAAIQATENYSIQNINNHQEDINQTDSMSY